MRVVLAELPMRTTKLPSITDSEERRSIEVLAAPPTQRAMPQLAANDAICAQTRSVHASPRTIEQGIEYGRARSPLSETLTVTCWREVSPGQSADRLRGFRRLWNASLVYGRELLVQVQALLLFGLRPDV